MSEFWTYFVIGLEHITELTAGYDHLLFILAFSAIYTFSQWKSLLMLVSAFTVGHSITLILTIFETSPLPAPFVEWLIPFSIVLTCILNFFHSSDDKQMKYYNETMIKRYVIILIFGLVHGLGFASYLRDMISKDNLWSALFAFNIGLEIGQIIIVVAGLTIAFLAVKAGGLKQSIWKFIVSSVVGLLALHLLVLQTLNMVNG